MEPDALGPCAVWRFFSPFLHICVSRSEKVFVEVVGSLACISKQP